MGQLLPLLLVSLLSFMTLATKWGDNSRVQNMCGRNVTGSRNYIDGLFNVSLEKLADVILDDQLYTTRYKDMFETKRYIQLANDIHDERATVWTENEDSWLQRNFQYGRHVHDVVFVKHAPVKENQTALYEADQLILVKKVRNADAFISGILIEIEYCAVRVGSRDSHFEVDVKLTVDNPLLLLAEDEIMTSSHIGFISSYHGLEWLLCNYFPTHPEDPVRLTLEPTPKQITYRLPVDFTPKRKILLLSSFTSTTTQAPPSPMEFMSVFAAFGFIAGVLATIFTVILVCHCRPGLQAIEKEGDKAVQYSKDSGVGIKEMERTGEKRKAKETALEQSSRRFPSTPCLFSKV